MQIKIIGLGYVGLPLAVEFGKLYPTLGVDINTGRIEELKAGHDRTRELTAAQMAESTYLSFTTDISEQPSANQNSELNTQNSEPQTQNYNSLQHTDNQNSELRTQNHNSLQPTANSLKPINSSDSSDSDSSLITHHLSLKRTVFIVTVPTPIDAYKKPDLSPLVGASKAVGKVLQKGDVVIYESTVYPGCTEEDCVPILEKESGLVFNTDFFCGYSPERINPGDKERTLTNIIKITSGSTPEIATFVDDLYNSILTNGTHKAPSIKVAEAAKLIENCQRDVNISFVNELALIFDRMGIDTTDVLEAAGTKWNFLKFKPGLVGGHCIGVDPYYMIHKAEQLGYYPAVIGAGRRVNDNMGIFVANKVVKLMIQKGIQIKGAKALILGITFKENCPDIRNTRVIDIYTELKQFGMEVSVHDPWADKEEVKEEFGIELVDQIDNQYQAVLLAVAHNEYKNLPLSNDHAVVFDIKKTIVETRVDGYL